MRFLEVNLLAYGPFREVKLNLSRGDRGLHLIYGPNEAGKSSALRAITDLLFGIPTRSQDDFLIEYPAMRLGATLADEDGSRFSFTRKKSTKAAIVDPQNEKNAIDDTPLLKMLTGVDREKFQLLFGLNQDRLREGGNNLAKASGALGEALFGAGTDLARLRGFQSKIEKEADGLFKPTGKNPSINSAIKAFSDARSSRASIVLSGEHWEGLRRALGDARQAAKSSQAELMTLVANQAKIRRFDLAAADLSRRRQLLTALAGSSGLPGVRQELFDEYDQTTQSQREGTLQNDLLMDQLAELKSRLAQLTVDKRWIECSKSIESLRDLWSESRREVLDLSGLRARAESDLRAVGHWRERLALAPEDATPRLALAARRKVDRLLAESLKFREALDRATSEELRAIREEHEAQRVLDSFPPPPHQESLRAALDAAEPALAEHTRAYDLAEEVGLAQGQANAALKALHPWVGSLEQLGTLPVPDDSCLRSHETSLSTLETEEIQLSAQFDQILKDLKKCRSDLVRLSESMDVPTEADLADARAFRDTLWSELRNHGVKGATPDQLDAYEQAVLKADTLSDRLRREADRVASKANLLSNQQIHEEEHATLLAKKQTLQSRREAIEVKWQALWAPLGITPGSAAEHRSWLLRLATAQVAQKKLVEQVAKHQASTDRLENARRTLLVQFQPRLGEERPSLEDLDIPGLVARARLIVNADRELEQKRENLRIRLESCQVGIREKSQLLETAKREYADWSDQWRMALESAGLPAGSDPEEARAALEDRLSYDTARDEADKSAALHEQAVRNLSTLETEAAQLLLALGLERAGTSLETTVNGLVQGLAQVREAQSRYQTIHEQFIELERQIESVSRGLRLSKAKLEAFATELGTIPEALPECVDRMRRRLGWQTELEEIEFRLSGVSPGTPVDELASDAAADDPATRPARLHELECAISEIQERLDRHNQTVGEKRRGNGIDRSRGTSWPRS